MKAILFVFFFVSGFCSLVYQVVWLRMAFAAFGVITPVVSLIVSVFMLGLALGSWAGGRWIEALTRQTGRSPLNLYGLAELGTAFGAFAVPRLFAFGERHLLGLGEMDSVRYLLLSALVITFSILPWCIFMGTTFPFVMAYVRRAEAEFRSSFSYLYLGNVLGAATGALLTALVLIEVLGFSETLSLAATCNAAIAVASIGLGLRDMLRPASAQSSEPPEPSPALTALPELPPASGQTTLFLLFITGFSSMAMEVVWTRAFTPITQTTIYAFALLLSTYLFATAAGSLAYRMHLRAKKCWSLEKLLRILAVAAFLPMAVTDPRHRPDAVNIVLGLFPLCAGLGYLTPMLVDQYSAGFPERAGKAYAVNIIGCILGPLCAGYVLLPALGVKWSLILLALPFTLFFLTRLRSLAASLPARVLWSLISAGMVVSSILCITYEDLRIYGTGGVLRRDHTATVITYGQAMRRMLLVNGVGITNLTPVTKTMAHLPLASLPRAPDSALVICFGMGTTFRSALSWGINVKAVELVPSVKEAFGYFFDDAQSVLENTRGRIVIDDGRRFLKRTSETFDVITVDPPPPVEAAGSSLLYSEQFYQLVRTRLRDDGILQQWFPGGEDKILHAVAGSLVRSFPYVRVLRSSEDWGYHFLASKNPIRVPGVDEMVARMPEAAKRDLVEWSRGADIHDVVKRILNREVGLPTVSDPHGGLSVSDDRPFNEYYVLRRQLAYRNKTFRIAH